jgi:hypothetical protein
MTFFLLIVACMFGVALSRGYVLSVLWAWFIVPAFSVPAIGLVAALGIAFISMMLSQHPSEYTKQQLSMDASQAQEIAIKKMVESLVFPWATLVTAWVVLKIAALFV